MNILEKMTALEIEAAEYGFKWETAEQIIAQIRSEITEIEVHLRDLDRDKLQEEIGDLIHAAFSLCVFCKFNAEETLEKSVNKFEKRFKAVQQLATKEGLTHLNGQSFEELMRLWDKGKKQVG